MSFTTWIEISYLCAFGLPFFFRHPLWGFATGMLVSLCLLASGFLLSGTLVNPEHDRTFSVLLLNILSWQETPFLLAMVGTFVSWIIKKGFDVKILRKYRFLSHGEHWTVWGIPFSPLKVFLSVIGMSLIALLMACLGTLLYFGNVEYFNRLRQERIAKASTSIAKRLSFSLPRKIDDTVTLQKVSSNGTTLTFYYLLNRKIAGTEALKILEERKKNIKATHCSNPSMEKVLRMGGAFRFSFTDVRGSEIGSFVFSKEECAA